MSAAPWVTRLPSLLVGAARVALGLLWLGEGIVKYRANFSGTDILLVVQSSASNSRVPDFYKAFTEGVLGGWPDLFGVVIPLLETGLGVALILGVLALPAAVASVGTLSMYWFADQLIGQYPVMLLLSTVVILWPTAASRYSLTTVLRHMLALRSAPARRFRA